MVTGGSRGLGRSMVLAFARAGADVIITSRKLDACERLAREVEEQTGRTALPYACHVGHWDELPALLNAAYERFGRLDVLVNNAGKSPLYPSLAEVDEELWDSVIAVNLKAVWLGMKVIAPLMRARGGGAIVNTASIAGLRGSPNIIAYTASKHAVVGMTRAAALELARHKIRVNAVCPAPIETPMTRELETDVKRERLIATIPMRRYGEPQEVASLVAFLASSDAEYITGAIYTVDGGAMA